MGSGVSRGAWVVGALAVLSVAAAAYAWLSSAPPEPEANLQTSNVSVANSIEHPLIGKSMPEVKLPALGGGEQSLSQYKGKRIVLSFWTTW